MSQKQSTDEQIQKYLDGNLDAWVEDLDRNYGTPYPDTVMKDVILDRLTGADDLLTQEINKLKAWFDSKKSGTNPTIRANPRVYFQGKLREISSESIRTLSPASDNATILKVSPLDLRKMKFIDKKQYKQMMADPSPGDQEIVIEFGGACSNGEKENQAECEEAGGKWNPSSHNIGYLGITHKTLMSTPLAIISLAMKKITFSRTTEIDKYAKIYIENKLKSHEYEQLLALTITKGNVDFSDITIAENSLPDPMHLGNYFSPKDPVSGTSTFSDMREMMGDSVRKMQIDYMHSFKDGMNESMKMLVTESLEEEALCCMFMAFLAANPKTEAALTFDNHKVPMWVGGANDGYWKFVSVPEFLETQKTKLKGFKIILEFLLNFIISDYKVALNPIMLNIIAMLTNILYMALASSIREAQSLTMDTITDFVEQEKKRLMDEVQKKVSEGKASDKYKAAEAALRCLPIEKVIIMMIRSLIGKESIFNELIALIARINSYFKLKATNAAGDGMAVEQTDFRVTPGRSLLKGAIEIIDFLLELNTDGLMICNEYHVQNIEDITGGPPGGDDPKVDCMFPDGSVAHITLSSCIDQCGDDCIQSCDGGPCPEGQMCVGQGDDGICVDSTCNPPCGDGNVCIEGTCGEANSLDNTPAGTSPVDSLSSAFNPLMPGYSPSDEDTSSSSSSISPIGGFNSSVKYGGRIDITGEGVDPLRLLVLQDSAEISKFFTAYLGVNSSRAADMTANAKAGTCMDGLDSDQKNEVTELLKEVGIDI